jgi:hypothetical protein
MADRDICEYLRRQIREHQAAIGHLCKELEVYVGTPTLQELESEEIKEKIADHRRAIEELKLGLESQGCKE